MYIYLILSISWGQGSRHVLAGIGEDDFWCGSEPVPGVRWGEWNSNTCMYICMHACDIYFVLKAWHRDQHIFSMYLKNTTNIQSITELTNPFQLHTLPVQAESLAKLKALRQSATKLQVEKLVRITCMPNDYIYIYINFIINMWCFQSLYASKSGGLITKSNDWQYIYFPTLHSILFQCAFWGYSAEEGDWDRHRQRRYHPRRYWVCLGGTPG